MTNRTLDPDIDPAHLPRFFEGYLAAPNSSINPTKWAVYSYPNILIWEFNNQSEAEQLAHELNIDDAHLSEPNETHSHIDTFFASAIPYTHLVDAMAEHIKEMIEPSWLVYILLCSDNSYYTGITNDLPKRLAAHNKGMGAKYTKTRLPVSILKTFPAKSKSHALKMECYIKQLPKDKKLQFNLDEYLKANP